MAHPPRSPVSQEIGTELERVVQRWRQLPLDRALSSAGRVRTLVQALADRHAEATGTAKSVVPDCGPATLMDQLTVMVYNIAAPDIPAFDIAVGEPSTATSTSTLVQDLANLRRELS